ncbi:MarR family winged helix-turn-helix transcriptional regulator [Nocardia sp. CS682]|uniref:MarR family winged helix-turn-helix transcriptional regulator n=1 Tax=Nocardia sp. CS682 TaxID=1047172 RepID=UPI0010756394|nr:MarR family transcriptional regulator [Nocardia sp. CS682]QBS43538.1 MarR family transcriptional regulator [Nocardia sp. CS682]
MADAELNAGLLMFIAHRSMEDRIFAELHAAGFTDITVAQGRVAQRISRDGIRLTELAEQAQITKQTAGFLVDQLERAGYAERVADPTDGRARLVRLSERGKKVAVFANSIADRIEAEWAAHLGTRRMRELRAALTALREITDPYAHPGGAAARLGSGPA